LNNPCQALPQKSTLPGATDKTLYKLVMLSYNVASEVTTRPERITHLHKTLKRALLVGGIVGSTIGLTATGANASHSSQSLAAIQSARAQVQSYSSYLPPTQVQAYNAALDSATSVVNYYFSHDRNPGGQIGDSTPPRNPGGQIPD
jgi:hypothetical protein